MHLDGRCLSWFDETGRLFLLSGSGKHHHQQTSGSQHHHPAGLSSPDVTCCDHHSSQTSHPSGNPVWWCPTISDYTQMACCTLFCVHYLHKLLSEGGYKVPHSRFAIESAWHYIINALYYYQFMCQSDSIRILLGHFSTIKRMQTIVL